MTCSQKPVPRKCDRQGVKVYSSESQSSLSFSMSLNSFVTPFSTSAGIETWFRVS